MSDYQDNSQQATPAAEQAPAPVIDLLGDRTFRPGHRNANTGRIDQLHISVQNNCIRFAGDVSPDDNSAWVSILLPKVDWGMFKQTLQRIALSKEAISESFRGYTNQDNNRQLDAILTASRSDDGIVSLTIASPDGRSKKYDFLMGVNTEIVDGNGVPLAPSEISRRRALAWKDEVSTMVDEMFKRLFRDFNQRKANNFGRGQGGGGNGGGGFKKQWNGGGGGNGGGGFKKQWNGGGGNQNGGFKKQWNGNGNNNNYPKKQWGGNGGGQGGGNNYQQRYQQGGQQQQQQQSHAPEATVNFDDYMPG